MNRREEIRTYIATKLKDLGVVYGNVYSSRTIPIHESELPVVVISIESESTEIVSHSSQSFGKVAQLSIEVAVDGTALNPEISLDRITAQIERSLMSDHTLGNRVNRVELMSTEIALMREGEVPIGMARMRYEISYFTGFFGDGLEAVGA